MPKAKQKVSKFQPNRESKSFLKTMIAANPAIKAIKAVNQKSKLSVGNREMKTTTSKSAIARLNKSVEIHLFKHITL